MADGAGMTPGDGAAEIEVEIHPAVARGLYSNMVVVSHTQDEFTLDFVYVQPQGTGTVQARLIVTPDRARQLAALLTEHLALHEAAETVASRVD